jgi:hypothetical protein
MLNTFIPLKIKERGTVFQVNLDYNERYSFKTTSRHSLTSFPGHERALINVMGSLKVSDLAKNVM